mmetsp:Transcript_32624/g.94336  ORF Transcript_32624/g.94336 Transcript_32624/m.94336 type:complete len:405 (+) Transcript_32624:200-1414(+)
MHCAVMCRPIERVPSHPFCHRPHAVHIQSLAMCPQQIPHCTHTTLYCVVPSYTRTNFDPSNTIFGSLKCCSSAPTMAFLPLRPRGTFVDSRSCWEGPLSLSCCSRSTRSRSCWDARDLDTGMSSLSVRTSTDESPSLSRTGTLSPASTGSPSPAPAPHPLSTCVAVCHSRLREPVFIALARNIEPNRLGLNGRSPFLRRCCGSAAAGSSANGEVGGGRDGDDKAGSRAADGGDGESVELLTDTAWVFSIFRERECHSRSVESSASTVSSCVSSPSAADARSCLVSDLNVVVSVSASVPAASSLSDALRGSSLSDQRPPESLKSLRSLRPSTMVGCIELSVFCWSSSSLLPKTSSPTPPSCCPSTSAVSSMIDAAALRPSAQRYLILSSGVASSFHSKYGRTKTL